MRDTYNPPLFIAEADLKRLHADIPDGLFEDTSSVRKKCDIGKDYQLVSFEEGIRLYNEEAFRSCGVCLEEGGEVSNWKERAEAAESSLSSENERNERLREEVVRLSSPSKEETPSDG